MTNPVGIHATHPKALAFTPPKARPSVSNRHVILALDQLAEELELSIEGDTPTERQAAQLQFLEHISERAQEICRADFADSMPAPTKYAGIAIDACALLLELQTLVARVNWFESGAVALSELQDAAHRATPIIAKLRKVQP